MDYVFRSNECFEYALYDYLTSFKKVKMARKNTTKFSKSNDVVDESYRDERDEFSAENSKSTVDRKYRQTNKMMDSLKQASELSYLDDEEQFTKDARNRSQARLRLQFQHPQHHDFVVVQLSNIDRPVLNFVNYLPHSDNEDQEYYKKVMLILFKLWRTKDDLIFRDQL